MAKPKLLNIPNALTGLRALGVPLFIYLALYLEADGWAILTLAIGGATDYLDGKLARAWGQESRFGEIADPAIDRLYIVATLIVLYLRDAMGAAVRDFVPFEEAFAKTDWSRFSHLPAFAAANRINAFGTYIRMEQESLAAPK